MGTLTGSSLTVLIGLGMFMPIPCFITDWLTLKMRIQFEILLLTFKVLGGTVGLLCRQELTEVYAPICQYLSTMISHSHVLVYLPCLSNNASYKNYLFSDLNNISWLHLRLSALSSEFIFVYHCIWLIKNTCWILPPPPHTQTFPIVTWIRTE